MQHTDNNPTFSVCTLGCKVNQYESQAISEDLERRGFSLRSFDEKCDVYIINTCTVTAESDRKSRQMIRHAVKCGGGNAIVIVVGCFSQAESETVGNIPGVTAAFGTADKSKVASYAADLFQKQTQGETLVFATFPGRITLMKPLLRIRNGHALLLKLWTDAKTIALIVLFRVCAARFVRAVSTRSSVSRKRWLRTDTRKLC